MTFFQDFRHQRMSQHNLPMMPSFWSFLGIIKQMLTTAQFMSKAPSNHLSVLVLLQQLLVQHRHRVTVQHAVFVWATSSAMHHVTRSTKTTCFQCQLSWISTLLSAIEWVLAVEMSQVAVLIAPGKTLPFLQEVSSSQLMNVASFPSCWLISLPWSRTNVKLSLTKLPQD